MTTIAWDGKTLAADRQTSDRGAIYRQHCKIVVIPGGYVACAGGVVGIHRFVTWLKKGMRGEAPKEDIGAILIKNGKVFYVEDDAIIEIPRSEKITSGCGWQWAAAALDFGKTAVEAVAYASTRDTYTGGGVDSVQPFKRTK